MKLMNKRIISLLLALVMILGMMSMTAFAAERTAETKGRVETEKKPYTAVWERFKVQVNQAPYIFETIVKEKVSVADQMSWTEGYQMIALETNASYGKPYPSTTGRQYSNNVPIPDGYTHVMLTMLASESSTSTGGLVFFDANDRPIAGHYIAGAAAYGVELKTYAIPSGTAYFVTSIWMDDSEVYPYDIHNYECYLVKGETIVKPDLESEHYEPVTGVIALPENYTADGEPTKLIMFAHGGHGYVDETHWYPTNADMEDTVKALLAAGYAVFDCNGYKDTPYEEWKAFTDSGNVQMGIGLPQVVEGYYNCYQYILENYNIEPGLYIQGCSQGGHTALTFAKMHPEDVTAIAWMAGHIDLYDQGYGYQTLENKRQVAELLGFSNTTFSTNQEALEAYEHEKADPFDPMKWITTVDGTDYLYGWSVPIKFFYGTADTILPQFEYVTRFHQALNNAGFTCELKWYEGFSHHDVAPAANEQCREDMISWFDAYQPHLHIYASVVTPPTCTEQGYTTYTCECGERYVDDYVGAFGHNYGRSFACSECGYKAKVSVLGDSISTYAGISGVKNAVYPNGTVKSVSETWWKQVVDTLGGEVLKINASGGSRILSDEYFNGAGIRDGNHAAYRERCVNLHVGNDSPDVILVFMGTNDFSYHVERECERCQILLACAECSARQDGNLNVCAACRAASGVNSSFCNLPLGTADSVDVSRETPTSSCEAYAIMLSKMKVAYPNAQIYCMGLLPRVNPYQSVSYHDHGQPTAFNAELKKVAENAGATFIDLEHCLDNSAATWSAYFGDAVHPTAAGMDQISEAVISGVLGIEAYMVSSEVADGVTLSGQSWGIAGNAYEASVAFANDGLRYDVRVIMNGMDITETAFDAQTGKIHIDNVNGSIVITIREKVVLGEITWSVGAVNSTNGSLVDMLSRVRTNMYDITRGAVITAGNGAEFCPVFYDKDGNFVSSPNAYDADGILVIPAGQYVYMRLMARNQNNINETMTPAYGDNITVTFGSDTASWSIGTIYCGDHANGSNADNYKNRIRTGFICIAEGLTVRATNNAWINVVFYDENFKILPTDNNCGWTDQWSSANAPAGTVYIRVAAKDESDMVLTVDYGENIAFAHGCIHCYENGFCIDCGKADPDDYLPGDINGDGQVNNKDLNRLFRFLSDYDVEVVEEALDVNGDDSVNNKDLTRLFQYLTDYDVEIF